MRSKRLISIGAGCICASGAAHAAQTVNFTYDALGRLVQSQIQSGPESGVTQVYQYDPAGNRIQYLVSGATSQTSTTLSMSNNFVNQTVAGTPLTVHFTGSSVYGTVTFTENGVFLGSTWVTDGQASIILEDFPRGVHTITAMYFGDGTHAAQTTSFTIRVQNLNWLPAVMELLSN
jgi:hypothetical protein